MCALACAACGASQGPFGREYVVIVGEMMIPPRDGTGAVWDPDGTPPDVFAVLEVDGRVVLETDTIDNSYEPSWNAAAGPLVIDETTELIITARDEDPPGSTVVMTCPPDGRVLREELADGGITCVTSRGDGFLVTAFEEPGNPVL